MPAGFQSITPGGVTQIDAESKTFIFKASGVASGGTYRSIEVSNCAAPLFFVGPGAALYGTQRVGTTYTFVIICASSSPVLWWVFDTLPDATPSTFGMQLLNPSGQLTFDALYPPLEAFHIQPPSVGFSLGITAGRTYAIHYGGVSKNRQRNVIGGGGFGSVEIVNTFRSMTISGTTLTVALNITETITGLDPGPGYPGPAGPVLMIVADMTGV